MVWTNLALNEIVKSIPIKIKEIHSDNGSEFINTHIQRFCDRNKIEFTRSRPYRKNDAPYVESKNWSMVRVYTGWRRYDTEEEKEKLEKLYRLVCLRYNLFMPTMKIIQKGRDGGKIKKKYSIDTPLNRLIKIEEIDEAVKRNLIKLRDSINLIEPSLEIERISEELDRAYEKKLRRYNYV